MCDKQQAGTDAPNRKYRVRAVPKEQLTRSIKKVLNIVATLRVVFGGRGVRNDTFYILFDQMH